MNTGKLNLKNNNFVMLSENLFRKAVNQTENLLIKPKILRIN